MLGIGAFAIAPMAPPPEPLAPPTVHRDVQLTAGPPPGAIPQAFVRNQVAYCSLICPHALQLVTTVPIAVAQTPVTFLDSLVATGSPLKAIGTAAASVTGPANAALTPLINNDVFLVVPKAFHALDVVIVEGFNVTAAVFTPGEFGQTVQTGRVNILNALNQPVGPPTTPTGATNILQVVAVSAVDVTAAVAFQAGELLLAGVVQVADAAAQKLAQTGDPAAALAAGVDQTRDVVATASAPVVSAVHTAVTNIRNSVADPFPAAAKPTSVQSAALTQTIQTKRPSQRITTRKAADETIAAKPAHKVHSKATTNRDVRRASNGQGEHHGKRAARS